MQVEIERNFKATPEQLYNLWTDPSQISEWFGVKVDSDPKVGGGLTFNFEEECGPTTGEYKELNPFTSVAFTWNSYNDYDKPTCETLVTVTITPVDETTTHMKLLHTGFKTDLAVKEHLEGWTWYYDSWEKKLV